MPSAATATAAIHYRIDPAQTHARLYQVTLTVAAPAAGQELSPGRSVDLTIIVRLRQDAIVLPRSAVMDATVAPKVYVVNSQGIVALRQVSVMRWPSANAIIERGLREGDRVVLDPATIRPGAHVRPVAPTPDG